MSERKFDDLEEWEKKEVREHYNICMAEESMMCNEMHKTVEDFWESHKDVDYDECD
mgnify:CR=1 FL=1